MSLLLRSAFLRLRPRMQGLTWLLGCVVGVVLLIGLWLMFWRIALPVETVWVLLLRSRISRLQRQKQRHLDTMRVRLLTARHMARTAWPPAIADASRRAARPLNARRAWRAFSLRLQPHATTTHQCRRSSGSSQVLD